MAITLSRKVVAKSGAVSTSPSRCSFRARPRGRPVSNRFVRILQLLREAENRIGAECGWDYRLTQYVSADLRRPLEFQSGECLWEYMVAERPRWGMLYRDLQNSAGSPSWLGGRPRGCPLGPPAPGRPVELWKGLILRPGSGTGASRADQGSAPPITVESRFGKPSASGRCSPEFCKSSLACPQPLLRIDRMKGRREAASVVKS